MKRIKLAYQLMLSYTVLIALAFVMIFGFNLILMNRMQNHFETQVNTRMDQFSEKIEDYLTTAEVIEISELASMFENSLTIDEARIYNDDEIIFYYKDIKKYSREEGEIDFAHQVNRNEVITRRVEFMTVGGSKGYLELDYMTLQNFTPKEVDLLDSVSFIYRIVLAIVTIIGLLIGLYMARRITNPIKNIGDTANDIQSGELSARASIHSRTTEICELRDSINYLADSLEKEDSLRKQMTSDMAHEIRTPITNLRNFFEAFIDGVYEANNENLSKCYHEILRMNSLVEKLSDIARLEEHNIAMNNEHIDLSQEAQTMVDLFTPRFKAKNIALKSNITENIRVNMDPSKVNQILSNILSNACRYTNEEGQVLFSMEAIKKSVKIEVIDNGIGISKEDLPFIFERFYRTEKSRNRETGGMGIGLTMVKQLVESYNGTIEIKSAEGQGTTVTITFNNMIIK